jgi:carbohydrate esterase-like sialic acid-specific acetylesterase/hemolysin type calcium-binding protein
MDVLVIGQSNASNWSHDLSFSPAHANTFVWTGDNWGRAQGEGAVAFTATLTEATGEPVRVVNAAAGGTSLLPNGGANWLATGASSPYGKMLAAVAASGLKPAAIVWIQGEQDAGSRVGTADYLHGLETLFARLGAKFGSVPVVIQPLILPQTGKEAIVAAQEAYVASHSNAHLVSPSVELLGRDSLHFTPVGYNVLGDLTAREVLSALSEPAGAGDVNRVYAGPGNDQVTGTDGSDVLLGAQGNDRLVAGAGSDLLSGGSGDDVLRGGPGSDLLTGDSGRDSFVFAEPAAAGPDRITDFARGVDRLVFDPSVYDLSRVAYDHASGQVSYNGQLVVTLQGAPVLGAGDISNVSITPDSAPSGDGDGDGISGALAVAGAVLGLGAWLL